MTLSNDNKLVDFVSLSLVGLKVILFEILYTELVDFVKMRLY